MFPSTLTGLFFFVVLLLPGFAYLVGKERHGTERHTSPFRETISVVAASVTTEVIVLALFALARWILPSRTPDVGGLIHGGNAYITGHYRSLAVWTLCMLALAVALAYFVTVPGVRRFPKRLLALVLWPLGKIQRVDSLRKSLEVIGGYPHNSAVSAWWIMFEKWPLGRKVKVGCVLDDGSYVAGLLGAFNNSADDSSERDLALRAPIQYRPPGATEPIPYSTASAVSIPASRIVTMFVGYIGEDTTSPSPTPGAVQPELEAAELAGQPVEEASPEPMAVPPS
jgi:hypothetical protein